MSFSTRRAKPVDASVACALVRDSIAQCCIEDHGGDPARLDAWLRNKTPENFAAWLRRGELCGFVADGAAGMAGFAMASTGGELLLCYVSPRDCGQGAGTALLQTIERWAAGSGLTELRLESTATALPFYRRRAYELSGPAVLVDGMLAQPMAKAV